MDAKTYVKTVKRICAAQSHLSCKDCPMIECSGCCGGTDIDPIPIVEQWLADHPEPVPLPGLPEKINPIYLNHVETNDTINAIIDYLKARENND